MVQNFMVISRQTSEILWWSNKTSVAKHKPTVDCCSGHTN